MRIKTTVTSGKGASWSPASTTVPSTWPKPGEQAPSNALANSKQADRTASWRADRNFKRPVRSKAAHHLLARNRPYVASKLRGRVACLANWAASRLLRRAPQTAHAAARSIRDKRAPTGSLTRQRNRDSSSCSQQHGLYRRPARPERQLALILLRRSALQVRQDLRNQLRLLDAGDDLQLPAAARAALDLDTEHSLQPSCPAHRHMPGRRRLDRISPRHRRRRCTAPSTQTNAAKTAASREVPLPRGASATRLR